MVHFFPEEYLGWAFTAPRLRLEATFSCWAWRERGCLSFLWHSQPWALRGQPDTLLQGHCSGATWSSFPTKPTFY